MFKTWLGRAFLAVAWASSALLAADDPQAKLTAAGLTKVGGYYLLDVDVHLSERLRDIHSAQAQLQAYSRQRQGIEDDITRATSVLDDLERKLADVDAQMDAAGKKAYATYNEMAAQHNEFTTQIRDGRSYLQRRTEDFSKLVSPSAPVMQVISLYEDMEAAQTKYNSLAANPDIKSSLDAASAAGPHFHLGPSQLFVQQFPLLKRQHDQDMKAAIKGQIYNGTLQVVATINQSSVPMIVDSGCSTLLLTAAAAKTVGVTISPNAKTVTATIANGTHIQQKVGTIASLTVGQYTLKDVECDVLPPGVGQDCLLGGSFLQHFLYQIDLNAAELRLTPISTNVTVDTNADLASGSPATAAAVATSQPASQPNEFEVTIQATIDSRDEFTITRDGLSFKHVTGRVMPTKVSINDETWDVSTTTEFPATGALEPLHMIDVTSGHVIKQAGRGTFTVTNDASGEHVLISDGHPGAAGYAITFGFAIKP